MHYDATDSIPYSRETRTHGENLQNAWTSCLESRFFLRSMSNVSHYTITDIVWEKPRKRSHN